MLTDELYRRPIPRLAGISGHESVPIRDCGEGLVPLSTLRPARLRIRPEYYMQGYASARAECFVRREVAVRLMRAAESLPVGLRLLILDAWRPLAVQRELYDAERDRLRGATPGIDESELERRTQLYVSLPSDSFDRPAPHLTGGAVDLTIEDSDTRPLEMGTKFDHFGPEAGTRYLEERLTSGAGLPTVDEDGLKNRRLLFHTMVGAGFTNYAEEWWHFDYGNQLWATIHKTHAIYGPAFYEIDAR